MMSSQLQISVCLEDEPDIVYPESDEDVPEVDGLRMEPAYSEVQQALAARFGSRDDVLVAGNCFIYFKNHGYPERVWLDCFVAFGVDRDDVRNRGCYYTWKTGKAPDFVLEIRTATRFFANDRNIARELYSALGISEYWTFDAAGAGRGRESLYGDRIAGGRCEEIALTAEGDGGVRGYSPTLGLDLVQENGRLRLRDPDAGGCVLNLAEERAMRLALEAENRQLRERLR